MNSLLAQYCCVLHLWVSSLPSLSIFFSLHLLSCLEFVLHFYFSSLSTFCSLSHLDSLRKHLTCLHEDHQEIKHFIYNHKKLGEKKNNSQQENLICGLGFTSILSLEMHKQQQRVFTARTFSQKGASVRRKPQPTRLFPEKKVKSPREVWHQAKSTSAWHVVWLTCQAAIQEPMISELVYCGTGPTLPVLFWLCVLSPYHTHTHTEVSTYLYQFSVDGKVQLWGAVILTS